MQTPAQLANDAAVNNRFQIQGFDPEEHHETTSVFDLSSAPPLQKHTSTAEIFMEVQHFVPTRFEDQMKFMMTIEANRKKWFCTIILHEGTHSPEYKTYETPPHPQMQGASRNMGWVELIDQIAAGCTDCAKTTKSNENDVLQACAKY